MFHLWAVHKQMFSRSCWCEDFRCKKAEDGGNHIAQTHTHVYVIDDADTKLEMSMVMKAS